MQQSEIEYYNNWLMTSKFDILQRDYNAKEDSKDERKRLYMLFIGKLLKEAE